MKYHDSFCMSTSCLEMTNGSQIRVIFCHSIIKLEYSIAPTKYQKTSKNVKKCQKLSKNVKIHQKIEKNLKFLKILKFFFILSKIYQKTSKITNFKATFSNLTCYLIDYFNHSSDFLQKRALKSSTTRWRFLS